LFLFKINISLTAEQVSLFNWELFKGLLFVIITSLLVYYLLVQSNRRLSIDKGRLEKREEILRRILENSNSEFGLFDENGQIIFFHPPGFYACFHRGS